MQMVWQITKVIFLNYTLEKFSRLEPGNQMFEKENQLKQTCIFGFNMSIFRGVRFKKKQSFLKIAVDLYQL